MSEKHRRFSRAKVDLKKNGRRLKSKSRHTALPLYPIEYLRRNVQDSKHLPSQHQDEHDYAVKNHGVVTKKIPCLLVTKSSPRILLSNTTSVDVMKASKKEVVPPLSCQPADHIDLFGHETISEDDSGILSSATTISTSDEPDPKGFERSGMKPQRTTRSYFYQPFRLNNSLISTYAPSYPGDQNLDQKTNWYHRMKLEEARQAVLRLPTIKEVSIGNQVTFSIISQTPIHATGLIEIKPGRAVYLELYNCDMGVRVVFGQVKGKIGKRSRLKMMKQMTEARVPAKVSISLVNESRDISSPAILYFKAHRLI